MRALFRTLTAWGIRPDTSVDEANYIRLTNGIPLFLLIASIVETGACFISGAYQAALLNSSAPFVFGGGLLLMRAGYTVLARVLVLTISYIAVYGLATILGPEAEIQVIILFGAALSLTFFPLTQWKYILFGLSLPVVCFTLLEINHYEPVLGLARANLSHSQLRLIRIASISSIWILIIGHFIYYLRGRHQAQERLISSAKMVALGQMAAGIAHEVNNPLFQIVGHAERLKTLEVGGSMPAAKVNEISDQIQGVAMRIGAVVHGLQALSRDASGDTFVEMPLHSLVTLTLDYCRARIQAHHLDLRVGEISQSWTVIGREAQLSEVLLNVLNNALDAVLPLKDKWIEIEAKADEKAVELAITDSGPGINTTLQQRMFDPFFTTKPVGKGTGLGLSISRGIMAAHRGRITYDTSSARTRFVIRIPRGRDLPSDAVVSGGLAAPLGTHPAAGNPIT